MSLTTDLQQLNQNNREKIPNEVLEVMDKATNDLKQKHLAEKTIQKGDTFPNTTLPNAKGEKVSLKELNSDKKLIISFYRGGWCPYCNLELKALQNSLEEFKANGAELVAISPETPDNSLSTSEKNELDFEVLSDVNNVFAKELGLVFGLPEDLKAIYDQFGIDVKKHNENDDYELPMPATFVLDENGKVIYQFVNEDYTKRADTEEILKAIKTQ
ncbi:peroxiredoxin-like family protein [Galbibacter mesophilus]|uniref:peroxiredoxin-like family protein n=1 Tax=Galbibacter mesophilus TaxID=379069 RepID=UPI00191EF6F2|nr:peroxiredoxin-like family protein [Galbibacter mesophilus]MCM5662998.1 AhpC/TSA family protein [Galbibacter mesophilus]